MNIIDIFQFKHLGLCVGNYRYYIGIGLTIFFNKHDYPNNWHIDIVIDILKWFVEIRIGAE